MMFWKKKVPAKAPKEIKKAVNHNKLTIKMRDKTELSWSVIDWDGISKTKPWRRCYTWFFGRTGEIFVMSYKTGETVFRREDITCFTVQTHAEMVDV